jgi:hypothetical protein
MTDQNHGSTTPASSTPSAGTATNIARRSSQFAGSFAKTQFDQNKKVYHSNNFKGEILYTIPIKVSHFEKMFDESFVTYVLQSRSTSASDKTNVAFVDETIVYVPELSGCLPFPDLSVIEEKLQRFRDQINGDEDADFKKLSEKAKKTTFANFAKSMLRLDRFPRFYSAQDNNHRSAPSRGDIVMVSFLDDNDWSSSGVLMSRGR